MNQILQRFARYLDNSCFTKPYIHSRFGKLGFVEQSHITHYQVLIFIQNERDSVSGPPIDGDHTIRISLGHDQSQTVRIFVKEQIQLNPSLNRIQAHDSIYSYRNCVRAEISEEWTKPFRTASQQISESLSPFFRWFHIRHNFTQFLCFKARELPIDQ